MYICVYVNMYICIHVYMCICIYVYMYIWVYVYMYICAYVHMCVYIYIYIYITSASSLPRLAPAARRTSRLLSWYLGKEGRGRTEGRVGCDGRKVERGHGRCTCNVKRSDGMIKGSGVTKKRWEKKGRMWSKRKDRRKERKKERRKEGRKDRRKEGKGRIEGRMDGRKEGRGGSKVEGTGATKERGKERSDVMNLYRRAGCWRKLKGLHVVKDIGRVGGDEEKVEGSDVTKKRWKVRMWWRNMEGSDVWKDIGRVGCDEEKVEGSDVMKDRGKAGCSEGNWKGRMWRRTRWKGWMVPCVWARRGKGGALPLVMAGGTKKRKY
jgi:hypothetical protein